MSTHNVLDSLFFKCPDNPERRFTCEASIRTLATRAHDEKIRQHNRHLAKLPEAQRTCAPVQVPLHTVDPNLTSLALQRAPSPTDRDTPAWDAWIAARCAAVRAHGSFLTEQQWADFMVPLNEDGPRRFRVGDRARFVGDDREERMLSGACVMRPHLQEGQITEIGEGVPGSRTLVFVPDVPAVRVHGEVVSLKTREGVGDYFLLERLP